MGDRSTPRSVGAAGVGVAVAVLVHEVCPRYDIHRRHHAVMCEGEQGFKAQSASARGSHGFYQRRPTRRLLRKWRFGRCWDRLFAVVPGREESGWKLPAASPLKWVCRKTERRANNDDITSHTHTHTRRERDERTLMQRAQGTCLSQACLPVRTRNVSGTQNARTPTVERRVSGVRENREVVWFVGDLPSMVFEFGTKEGQQEEKVVWVWVEAVCSGERTGVTTGAGQLLTVALFLGRFRSSW